MASSKGKLSAFVILLTVVVAVGGIGSYFIIYQQTGPTERTTSVTSSLQTASRPSVTYSMFGKIFFDYNGNGRQEPNEPPVPDVTVALNNVNRTVTNATGWYTIGEISTGLYKLRLFPPKNFRYMCESDAEFRAVQAFYDVLVVNDTRQDIGLMEGFLTMSFAKGTNELSRRLYVDIANKSFTSRGIDWQGGDQTYQRPGFKHTGIDYFIKEGTPILAAAPGTVEDYWPDPYGGVGMLIKHSDGLYTSYVHLKETRVKIGQIVRRGELIALSGSSDSGTIQVLHFEVDYISRVAKYAVDPYRSLVPPLGSPLSLWTKDNDPQFFV